MARVVARSVVDRAGLEAILRPRTDLVLETDVGGGRYQADHGPLRDYARQVEVEPAPDDVLAAETAGPHGQSPRCGP